MVVAPLGQASTLPALIPVSRVERVVRRPKSAKDQRNSGSEDGQGDEAPIAAMRTPAEASSSAIQAALSNLELGG
jgi:hypothetical protein